MKAMKAISFFRNLFLKINRYWWIRKTRLKTVDVHKAKEKDLLSLGREVYTCKEGDGAKKIVRSSMQSIRNKKTGRVVMFPGTLEQIQFMFGKDYEIVESAIKESAEDPTDLMKGNMRTVKQLTNNKFLNIKEVKDTSMHVSGFQFAERRGVDSVAFICYDSNSNKYLLNNEYTPPTNEFFIRAFGGSLDKQMPRNSIVKEEVQEEAGYMVTNDMVYEVGLVFVSTQMNQRCFLYLVNVTGVKQTGRSPENKIEEMATTLWREEIDIIRGDDWKSIVIIKKAKEKKII